MVQCEKRVRQGSILKKILFVCTGNTCRSPMAAGILNRLLLREGMSDITVQSAGIAANPGEPASPNAQVAAKEIGVDLSNHRARQVDSKMIAESEAVYCMSEGHRRMLLSIFPKELEKIRVLGEGVPDPFGGDLEVYRRCRDAMVETLKKMAKRMKADEPNQNQADE